MEQDIIENIYRPIFKEYGFIPTQKPYNGITEGCCWELDRSIGVGYFWVYAQKDLFTILIHDFYFHKDEFMEFTFPECMSITKYDSISGEELKPYRKLCSGVIKTFIGGDVPFKALIHKNIPIKSIGIGIMPAYYNDYLKKQYSAESGGVKAAFSYIDQTDTFPEMKLLLSQIQTYRGDGISAKLFYESKVSEAVSLVLSRHQKAMEEKSVSLSNQDKEALKVVAAYIDDHYANELQLELLTRIACMGTTKLKSTFKRMFNSTITEYIQARRMGQAEHLLSFTDLSVGQVAQSVGYSSASRFTVLFKKSTGLLPLEFRKLSRK